MSYKVLIVEDNPEIANLVQLHLRDINCDSDIATDGENGLTMFEQRTYDLVLLDLMLPVVDGLAVCRRLRELPGYVPIIMLTSKSSELDRVSLVRLVVVVLFSFRRLYFSWLFSSLISDRGTGWHGLILHVIFNESNGWGRSKQSKIMQSFKFRCAAAHFRFPLGSHGQIFSTTPRL